MLFLFYFIFPQASNYRQNEKQFFNFFENVNHLTRSSNTLSLPDRHFLVRACKVLRCFPEYWCRAKKKFRRLLFREREGDQKCPKVERCCLPFILPSFAHSSQRQFKKWERKEKKRKVHRNEVCVCKWVSVCVDFVALLLPPSFPPNKFLHVCSHIEEKVCVGVKDVNCTIVFQRLCVCACVCEREEERGRGSWIKFCSVPMFCCFVKVRELHVCLHSRVVVMGCKQLEWMASSQEGIWLDRDKVREVVTAKTTIKEHQKLLSERVNVSHTWIFVSAFVLQRKIVLTSIWADGDFVWCPHYSFFPMNSNAWPDDWSHLSLSLFV